MCFHFAVFLFLEILLKLLIWNMLTDDSIKCGSTGSVPLANSNHELLVSMILLVMHLSFYYFGINLFEGF